MVLVRLRDIDGQRLGFDRVATKILDAQRHVVGWARVFLEVVQRCILFDLERLSVSA